MPGLQVAASTSSFRLAEKGLGPVELAKQLGVASVLTGSVRMAGDRMKIRVELVTPLDGKPCGPKPFHASWPMCSMSRPRSAARS
jgi:TolB-like protein